MVKAHDYVAVRAAVKAHPEVLGYRGNKGENLLHICCGVKVGGDVARSTASVNTARVLIDAGIDVDPKFLRMFVEHGARLDIADCAGATVDDLVSRIRDERVKNALKRCT